MSDYVPFSEDHEEFFRTFQFHDDDFVTAINTDETLDSSGKSPTNLDLDIDSDTAQHATQYSTTIDPTLLQKHSFPVEATEEEVLPKIGVGVPSDSANLHATESQSRREVEQEDRV